MTHTPEKHSIKEEVLNAIHSGRIVMRPKWHFVLKTALALVGAVFCALALLYLISFIIFVLRHTGVLFVPAFGLRGISVFLFSLPWVLILLSFIFVAILEILVAQYAFAYRRPLLYSLFGILFVVTAGGFIIATTPLHPGFFQQAKRDTLPLAGPLYRQFGSQRFNDIHKGVITEFTDDGFFIQDANAQRLRVLVAPTTQFPYEADFLSGEVVVILGQRNDGTVRAVGVRKIYENGDTIPTIKMQMRKHFFSQ